MRALPRPRRAFRTDIRFLIGVTLVAASITGVWLLVSASDDATPVLRASRTITEGEVLVAGDFQVAEVGLGPIADGYLAPGALERGRIAGRTLEKGELVPASAVVAADSARTTTIVVESSTRLPQDLDAGQAVDLWHAPPLDDGRAHDVPRILVADAVVRDVTEAKGLLAEGGASVELVIDRSAVTDVLAAIIGGSALSIVPAGPGS